MFGPPQRFTIASTCSWLGHQVSGLRQDTFRSLQTRFRFGSVPVTLNLASHRNSPAHSTKGTTSHAYGALSACKLTVSGSLSLPSRGSFHLSLTVLFAIGHMVVFSLLGWSPFLPSGFHVSRRTPDPARTRLDFAYGTVTRYGLSFNTVRLSSLRTSCGPYPVRIPTDGLGWSDFARHYFRNRLYFLFLRVLRCFSSPGSPRTTMCSSYGNATLLALSSLIRISADLKMFAPPRSFSQLTASFFGAIYQGILREPFVA